MKKASGQILILVLLVVVVALSVGLSVASRNITNLRTSIQTEQSQRAFSSAEGGIEDTLSSLSSIVGANAAAVGSAAGYDRQVAVGSINANVNIKGASSYESLVEEGFVAQIDLTGASGNVDIEWSKNDGVENIEPASVEVTQVYGTAPSYAQTRWAFSGGTGFGRGEEGFCTSNCALSSGPPCGFSVGDYNCKVVVPVQANPIFLRVRPFWVKTTLKISGGNMPVQTYAVSSTASTDLGITRKVQVTKTVLPQLPASFDYVLFSEGAISK